MSVSSATASAARLTNMSSSKTIIVATALLGAISELLLRGEMIVIL